MSRANVRAQLAQFIAPPIVDGINQVLTSFPKRINFEINALPSQRNRCVAVIFIESEREERLSVGGIPNSNRTQGWKRVDYSVAIQIFHHSLERNAEDAMTDFDKTIDNLKDRLRSDHRFGDQNGTLVWQAAEPAIDVSYGEPISQNGTATETWATLRFDVTEMIKA